MRAKNFPGKSAEGGVRRAFTLLEVLIALAILTVGSTAIVALYSAALETYRRSEVSFVATEIAWEALDTAEELVQQGHGAADLPQLLRRCMALQRNVRLDVAASKGAGEEVSLTVRVTWEGRGRSRSWIWKRTVCPMGSARGAPLPPKAPFRYRLRVGAGVQ